MAVFYSNVWDEGSWGALVSKCLYLSLEFLPEGGGDWGTPPLSRHDSTSCVTFYQQACQPGHEDQGGGAAFTREGLVILSQQITKPTGPAIPTEHPVH